MIVQLFKLDWRNISDRLKREKATTEDHRDKSYKDKLDGKIAEARWLQLDG